MQKLITLFTLLTLNLSPIAVHAAVSSDAFSAGDLIKASGPAVYYYASNGKRYVFPNDKTYFTWYKDFADVRLITDGDLSQIPIGGNVTYRPGYKMVKITTDPKVYAVDRGGVLRWVQTEQLAETLYGFNWQNRIDDVPDPFFVNYKVGTSIEMASEYSPQDVLNTTPTIAADKLFDETQVSITIANINQAFVPRTTTIKKGTEVTWTNRDIVSHTVTGAGFDSGILAPGATYKRRFNSVGSFDYKCTIHPVMTGTINVAQ